MALQSFRDKQKTIYWIIALFVIPSFIILGYSQVLSFNKEKLTVGEINGQKFSQQQYTDFYRRIKGVNFGYPVFFSLNGSDPTFSDKVGVFFALALLEDAKAHGIRVTDDEVSTYIKAQFGFNDSDDKKLEAAIKNALKTVIRLDSIYEYKQAVYEWLMIKKFLNIIDNSVFVPTALASIVENMESTSYRYGKLTIPTSSYETEAIKEVDDLSADTLKTEAATFITKHQNENERKKYSFLWTDPKWQFEYIAVPLVVDGLDPEVTDEEIASFYTSNQYLYRDKEGKPLLLEDIKEKVKEDYTKGFRARKASTTLSDEYGRFLNRMLLKGDNTDKQVKKITLEDIDNDPRLTERGMITGTSGKTPMTAFDIADNKTLYGSNIQYMLATLDKEFRNAAKKDAINGNDLATQALYDEFTKSFRGFTVENREYPISSPNVLFKIRLIKYEPGKARKLTDKDSEDLIASIKEEMIQETAMKKAMQIAENSITELKENKREIAKQEVKEEESSYFELQRNFKQLRTAKVGEAFGPFLNADSSGYDIIILYGKDIKKNSATPKLTEFAQTISIGWRGNSLYTPEFQMQPVIKIGQRLAGYLHNATQVTHRISYTEVLAE